MIALRFTVPFAKANEIALDIPIRQPQHRLNSACTLVSHRRNVLINLWPDMVNQKLNWRDRFKRRGAALLASAGDDVFILS